MSLLKVPLHGKGLPRHITYNFMIKQGMHKKNVIHYKENLNILKETYILNIVFIHRNWDYKDYYNIFIHKINII